MTDNIIELVANAGTCAVIGCNRPQTDGLCTAHRAEWEAGVLRTDRFDSTTDVLGVNW
ncbi:hypothetical protein ACQHIV_15845 [Kribbella sp. GL6]|uniref:hypothetical protein n=1 Tax=Kribbella sp. GL6 TaxID=3419765 RepID=UPI003D03F03A